MKKLMKLRIFEMVICEDAEMMAPGDMKSIMTRRRRMCRPGGGGKLTAGLKASKLNPTRIRFRSNHEENMPVRRNHGENCIDRSFCPAELCAFYHYIITFYHENIGELKRRQRGSNLP